MSLILPSGICLAEETDSKPKDSKKLYRVIDKNGKVHFSDQPSAGSEEINIEEVTTIKMEKTKVDIGAMVEDNESRRDPNAEYYDFIGFENLTNDGVVRNNGGTVTLTAKFAPVLSKSHYIKFFIDGKQVGENQKELTIIAKEIEYGPHTTFFEVVSQRGVLVQRSETISFNLLHVVRKRVSSINNLTSDYFKSKLPQHPKVPTFQPEKQN